MAWRGVPCSVAPQEGVWDSGRLYSPRGSIEVVRGGKVLWVWQDCVFGSVPIAFPFWKKHPFNCPLPFHHRWLLPSDAASPCVSSIPGHWCQCKAPALPQAWLWMCVGGLRAVKIKFSGLL